MSANTLAAWLDDVTLSNLAAQGAVNPSLWAARYDPTCPSEFYRGYATLVARVGEALRGSATSVALARLIDEFHQAIQTLPADERRNGANFALTNVASYA
jgi:hypothetical protein